MNRSELSDLVASGPANRREKLERASDAYDAEDYGLAADLLSELACEGQTTWHERAAGLANDIELESEFGEWPYGMPL